MKCFVQLQNTLLNWLASDAVNLQPCHCQTLKQQRKLLCLILSWLYRTWWDRINIAKHFCAGDGFSNKYSPGIRRHNSHWLWSVLHWITLTMSLILSLFLVMNPLARALSNTSTELAAPVLSMLSIDKKSKQEAEEKYCVCLTGLQIYTD